jgi:putative oxidoreductase
MADLYQHSTNNNFYSQTVPAPTRRWDATARALLLDDLGKLLLRVSVGALLMLHGIAKLGSGVDGIAGMLAQRGWPGELAYAVFIGELLAPLAMMLGVWTRPAALVAAVNMVVAIALAHAADIFCLGPQGGWAIELQGLYLFGALAVMLLGGGRFSLGGLRGRFN